MLRKFTIYGPNRSIRFPAWLDEMIYVARGAGTSESRSYNWWVQQAVIAKLRTDPRFADGVREHLAKDRENER